MTEEYRRGLLTGGPARWESIPIDEAERVLSDHPLGVGELGDQLVDRQQLYERRRGSGPWELMSYWDGAADAAKRYRHQVVDMLKDEQAQLRKHHGTRLAQATREDGVKAAIEDLKKDLKPAREADDLDRAAAADLEERARTLDRPIAEAQREADSAPAPTPALAEANLEAVQA